MNIDIGGCLMHFLAVFWVSVFWYFNVPFLSVVVGVGYLAAIKKVRG